MKKAVLGAVAVVGLVGLIAVSRTRAPDRAPARAVSRGQGDVVVGPAVAAGALAGPEFRFSLGVYHLKRPAQDPRAVFDRLAKAQRGLVVSNALRKGPVPAPAVWLETPPVSDFPPPAPQVLNHLARGLSEDQKRALASAHAVSALLFAGPAAEALPAYRQALALVDSLVSECGGVIWDDGARLMLSPEAWAERLEGWSAEGLTDVRPHISIAAYREGELLRMVTLGMRKFALPDVVVNQVATHDDAMTPVINLLCQRLLEGARLERPGRLLLALDEVRHPGFLKSFEGSLFQNARKRATVDLAEGKPDQGDPDNRLIELVFPGPVAGLQERHVALVNELFGVKDSLLQVEHDGELLRASEKARQRVLTFKGRYATSVPVGEQLLVKAPFVTPKGGNEWMWVEVVRWEGKTIRGILQNDPFEVPGLKAGAHVEVDEGALFDYALTRADGSTEGNETGKLMEKRK